MLAISRKRGESVWVGDAMVQVVEVYPDGRVTLGIEAPKATPIRRAELPPRPPISATVWGPVEDAAE